MDSLDLTIRLQSSLAQLPPDTTLLDTTKGHARVAVLGTVNPHHARLNLRRNTVRALDILREDRCSKPVLAVIRQRNSLLLGFEARNHHYGPENLLAPYAHRRRDVGEDSGRDEEALTLAANVEGFSARGEGGALVLANINVLEHALELDLGHLGSLVGVLVPLAPDLASRLERLEELGDELLVNVLLDEDAGGGGADLALVGHDAHVRPLDGLLEVGVAKDEEGGLAARLEGDVLERLGGLAHDGAGRGGAAREGDLVDERVAHEGAAGDAAEAIDKVDDARGEAGFLDEGAEVEDAQRGLFRGLEDDCVAAGEGWAEFPGGHAEGVVPGDAGLLLVSEWFSWV